MHLCLFEDDQADDFLPLTWFRPVYDLRCGMFTMRERIVHFLRPSRMTLHARPHLVPFLAEENPRAETRELGTRDCVLVNGRTIMSPRVARAIKRLKPDTGLATSGAIIAARLTGSVLDRVRSDIAGERAAFALPPSIPLEEIGGEVVSHPWELISRQAETLESDFDLLRSRLRISTRTGPLIALLNRTHVRIGKKCTIDPGTVIDGRNGPVVIGDGVRLHPGAVIEGPAFIGARAVLKAGARIYGPTTIGPVCKVGGEVDSSILQGFANKQHDGFLGHSYLASWVNLGAGTTTSNLKNTYGTIRAYGRNGLVDTGSRFLGLLAGDHAKTGINVSLDTGTVIGPSSNIYGSGLPPKFVPSFSWGEVRAFTTYEPSKALEVAVRVMARRDIAASETYRQLFLSVFDLSAHERTAR